MRAFFTFLIEGEEQKKTSVKEGISLNDCEMKLREQYPNISKVLLGDIVENGQEGILTGQYLLSISR
jgi:hypothetical protein